MPPPFIIQESNEQILAKIDAISAMQSVVIPREGGGSSHNGLFFIDHPKEALDGACTATP
jgi:hypothetical protein